VLIYKTKLFYSSMCNIKLGSGKIDIKYLSFVYINISISRLMHYSHIYQLTTVKNMTKNKIRLSCGQF